MPVGLVDIEAGRRGLFKKFVDCAHIFHVRHDISMKTT